MSATVLIVDDDALDRRFMERALRRIMPGIDVRHAAGGEEGLGALADCLPDVVILDLSMPGTDGFDVLSGLAASGIKVPVVMMSSSDRPAERARAAHLGARQFVPKPISSEGYFTTSGMICQRYLNQK